MTHKLLVVTFEDDLAQFAMFCHCLNKNWQGNKNLIVVIGKNTSTDRIRNIIGEHLSSQWTVEIKDTAWPCRVGWNEQQVNKIIHSVDSNADDVIVFDSKDFLLRSCDYSTFKKNNQYRVTYYVRNKKLVDMWPNLSDVMDEPIEHLPAVLNLTPWIWNVEQLSKYWHYINDKFGSFQSWKGFPAGTEIYGYYIFVWTNPECKIKFLTPADTPFLIAGGWADQNLNDMIEQAELFDENTNLLVWKHSRRLKPECIDVTRSLLCRFGIDHAVVEKIFQNYAPATREWG